MTDQIKLSPAMVREHLTTKYTDDADLIREYCDEAEHQEGEDVWQVMYGSNLETIDTDFELYRENSGDPTGKGIPV